MRIEGSWKSIDAPMNTARQFHCCVTVGNRFYAIGGEKLTDNTALSEIEYFEVKSNRWIKVHNMPIGRSYFAASAYKNSIYCMGGYNVERRWTDTVDIYDTEADTWKTGTPMPEARIEHTAVCVGNKVYVVGGQSPSGENAALYIYDIPNDSWSKGPDMLESRRHLCCAAVGQRIYCAGFTLDANEKTTLLIYDITTASWSFSRQMEERCIFTCLGGTENRVYCAGHLMGEAGTVLRAYDIKTDTWLEGDSLPSFIQLRGGILDGKLYGVGGQDCRTVDRDTSNLGHVFTPDDYIDPTPPPPAPAAALPTSTWISLSAGATASSSGISPRP